MSEEDWKKGGHQTRFERSTPVASEPEQKGKVRPETNDAQMFDRTPLYREAEPTGTEPPASPSVNITVKIDSGTLTGESSTTGSTPAQARRRRKVEQVTVPLREMDENRARFDDGDLKQHAAALMRDRLLLISADVPQAARAAAYGVIDRRGIALESVLLLDFEGNNDLTSMTLYEFLGDPPDRVEQTVVVIDGTSLNSQTFIGSTVLDTTFAKHSLAGRLTPHRVELICIMPRGLPKRHPFVHWRFSFLGPILRGVRPNDWQTLATTIETQRAQGSWSRDDDEFYQEVTSCLDQHRLDVVVAERAQRTAARSGGKSSGERKAAIKLDARPVHRVVQYVAAFFPALTPYDFKVIVEALLHDKTTMVPATVTEIDQDGKRITRETQTERTLLSIWAEASDAILVESHVTPVKGADASFVMGFGRPEMRERVAAEFKKSQPMGLLGWFLRLHEAGLLYTGSERIAKPLVTLTLQAMRDDATQFSVDWLVTPLLAPANVAKTETRERFTHLLRAMLATDDLVKSVDAVLNRLMARSEHALALDLVRRLRFVEGFDEMDWIRRIVDQAPEDVRDQAGKILARSLISSDLRVYQTLRQIAAWMPDPQVAPARYSTSQRLALVTVLDYAYATANQMPLALYGAWPSHCPLFILETIEAARTELGAVMSWLLHPGMQRERDQTAEDLAGLIAVWAYILYGKDRPAPDAADRPDDTTMQPLTVLDALLSALVERTTAEGGPAWARSVITHWDAMLRHLTELIPAGRAAGVSWIPELIWRRHLLRSVIIRYRTLEREARLRRRGAAAADVSHV